MAAPTESNSSSIAPVDFRLYTSYDDCTGTISVAVEKCKLCGTAKRPFTCNTCVNKGDFVFSKYCAKRHKQSYCERRERWTRAKASREEYLKRIENLLRKHQSVEQKMTECENIQRKLDLIQKAIKQTHDVIESDKTECQKIEQKCQSKRVRMPKLYEKKQKICTYMAKLSTHTSERRDTLASMAHELALLRQNHVQSLNDLIFPITEIAPSSRAPEPADSDVIDTVSALAEARNTAYIRGRWVYTDNGSELHYRVVEPLLPGNGDYSSYSDNMSDIKESSTSSMLLGEKNASHTLVAGLSLTSQFLAVMTHFLGANLPIRLCYSEFSRSLSDHQFARAVWRLNHNILHLCFSQGVNPEQLHPRHTVHNVLLLLRTPSLGSIHAYEMEPELMHSMEKSYPRRDDADDVTEADVSSASDSDEWSTVDPEWERVPAAGVGEMDFPYHDESYVSGAQTQLSSTSYAGGLFSSVTSFWRK